MASETPIALRKEAGASASLGTPPRTRAARELHGVKKQSPGKVLPVPRSSRCLPWASPGKRAGFPLHDPYWCPARAKAETLMSLGWEMGGVQR